MLVTRVPLSAKPRHHRAAPPVKRVRTTRVHAALTEAPALTGEALENYETCLAFLQSEFNLSTEDGNKVLNKAFGFGNQGYWRGENVDVVPTLDKVEENLDFLYKEIGLEQEEVAKVLKKFPEVLGQKLDERLRANVKRLAEAWKIEGDTLKSTCMRRPEILGYNIDCVTVGDGGCLGECNRCWARF